MTACQSLYSVYRCVCISHLLGVAWEVFVFVFFGLSYKYWSTPWLSPGNPASTPVTHFPHVIPFSLKVLNKVWILVVPKCIPVPVSRALNSISSTSCFMGILDMSLKLYS